MKNPGSLQKYKETLNNLGLANLSRYDYHLKVARALTKDLGDLNSMNKKKRNSNILAELEEEVEDCRFESMEGKRSYCSVCSFYKDYKGNRPPQTSFHCAFHQEPLCKGCYDDHLSLTHEKFDEK